jgi:hypothetical protein
MWQPVASGTIRIVRPRQDSAFESADVFHREMRPALCGRVFSKGRKGGQSRQRTSFPNRCCHKNARKTVPSVVPRCPYWCHSVFLVLSQFSPFCTPDSRGQGDRYGPKARAINAKKPQENLEFRGKTLRFEASCRSGETEFEPWVPVRAFRLQDRCIEGRPATLCRAAKSGANRGGVC